MQLRAELVHAETGVRVVQLSAWQNGECLGSTLAEAASVELAEQQAEARLRQRLAGRNNSRSNPSPQGARPLPPDPSAGSLQTSLPKPAPSPPSPSPEPAPPQAPAAEPKPPAPAAPSAAALEPEPNDTTPQEPAPLDPEDWSDELALIDVQLQRLGWSREQEGTYLERAFGHPSRSRLTTYADLVAYGQALTACPSGADPASVPVPLRRRDLLSQCDQLLAQLQWDQARGRAFLEQHFQLPSRRLLNDEQLLQFNMLLESEAMAAAEKSR